MDGYDPCRPANSVLDYQITRNIQLMVGLGFNEAERGWNQIGWRINEHSSLVDLLTRSVQAGSLETAVDRPINVHHSSQNLVLLYVSPKSAIQTAFTVVSKNEIRVCRDRSNTQVVSGIDGSLDDVLLSVLNVGIFLERLTIHIDHLLAQFHDVSRNANYTFDKGFCFVFWKPEDDHIAPLKWSISVG